MVYVTKIKMDTLVFHIDSYVTSTKEPTLMGLRFYLTRYTDNYYKDAELTSKLQLYLEWLEQDERYEECTYVHQMIKENERTSI